MYHVSMAVPRIYGWTDEGGEDGDGKEGREIPGDCLASYVLMTWFYVVG